jgi:type I restriction enzyme, R subunit
VLKPLTALALGCEEPANSIQRAIVADGSVKIIDNIPAAKARELFEHGVKSPQDPIISGLKRKAWEHKDYQPTEEELAAMKARAAAPDIILSKEQLQRIYQFPAGSIWDFFLNVLGVKRIPTTQDRIEAGFETYLQLYNFNRAQVAALRKIKNAIVANLSLRGKVELLAIFANPIYARLIGSFEDTNQRFDGRLSEVVAEMRKSFNIAA